MNSNLIASPDYGCRFKWIKTKESAICEIENLTNYVNDGKSKIQKLETFIPLLIDLTINDWSKEGVAFLGECVNVKYRLLAQIPKYEEEIFVLNKMLDTLPTEEEWEKANKASFIH